jgi:hypothetical protein
MHHLVHRGLGTSGWWSEHPGLNELIPRDWTGSAPWCVLGDRKEAPPCLRRRYVDQLIAEEMRLIDSCRREALTGAGGDLLAPGRPGGNECRSRSHCSARSGAPYRWLGTQSGCDDERHNCNLRMQRVSTCRDLDVPFPNCWRLASDRPVSRRRNRANVAGRGTRWPILPPIAVADRGSDAEPSALSKVLIWASKSLSVESVPP